MRRFSLIFPWLVILAVIFGKEMFFRYSFEPHFDLSGFVHSVQTFSYFYVLGLVTAFFIHKFFQPSPTVQGCTPEGGVSSIGTDVNSTGGAHE